MITLLSNGSCSRPGCLASSLWQMRLHHAATLTSAPHTCLSLPISALLATQHSTTIFPCNPLLPLFDLCHLLSLTLYTDMCYLHLGSCHLQCCSISLATSAPLPAHPAGLSELPLTDEDSTVLPHSPCTSHGHALT